MTTSRHDGADPGAATQSARRWIAEYGSATAGGDTVRSERSTFRSGSATEPEPIMPRITLSEPEAGYAPTDFWVRRRIGDGGMGVVDAAEQRALAREVAIKRVRMKGDALAHQTLIQEARLVAQLDHPNIPPVHLLANDDAGAPVLVMKRIDGVTWRALIDDSEHPYWSEITGERLAFHLTVIRQVAQALDYAHSKGVLHRDVKVDNVMLGPYGEVYLLDWGVAVRLDEQGCAPSDPYGGTPNYSAPEMFNEAATLTVVTDVYLLGATLHHVLMGTPIHQGDSLEAVLIGAMLSIPYKYPSTIAQELATLCTHACSADSTERPPTARAFRDAIDDYWERRHSVSRLRAANQLLSRLGLAIQEGDLTSREIDRLGIQCRFAFEQLLEEDPAEASAKCGLTSAIETLAWYELRQGNVESARRLISELRAADLAPGRLSSLVRRLSDVERQKRTEMGELATQIQYRLLERLQNAEAELAKSVDYAPGDEDTAIDPPDE